MKHHPILILVLLNLMAAGQTPAMTLQEAITLGKQHSLEIQGPRIDRVKVEGQIREAWSNALPQIEATAAYQNNWKSPVLFFQPDPNGPVMPIKLQQDNAATGAVTLNQPLFTFGRVSYGLKAAYAARDANQHLTNNTDKTLELEVMKGFWAVLLMRDVVEIRQNSLTISDSSLSRVQRMRDVGLMSDYDVLRIKVQADNQLPQLQQAQNNLHLAELSLKNLLGVSLDTVFSVDGSLTDFNPALGTDATATRLARRDDLEALHDLTNMYRNLYTVYRNARYPILAGQVNYSWQWSNDKWHLSPYNNASSVYGGLALTIPIWSSGRVEGKAQQAEADWRKAELDLKKAERGARLQYEAAISSYTTAVASESAAAVTVTQAQQARSIAQTKLAQGQITPLEMDAAQLDELVARVTLAQARYNRLVAAADARMALGLSPYFN